MGTLFKNASVTDPDYFRKKQAAEKEIGRKLTTEEYEQKYYKKWGGSDSTLSATGTSIFDPVLCETQYLWYTKEGDSVLDPFAGGSVRGIVAVELGRKYTGVDLRPEQVEANIQNAEQMCKGDKPKWICGDSVNIKDLAPGEYDFILTCPPYGNLEVYSDDPADISNMSDEDFDETYRKIMHNAVDMLRQDRFAVVVVGNYRDKKGYMRDLVGLTVRSMEEAGARYYNDAIFVSPAGSLPIRAGIPFQTTRKLGKTHQYVLVFVKGDPKKATQRLGDVQIPDLTQFVDGEEL